MIRSAIILAGFAFTLCNQAHGQHPYYRDYPICPTDFRQAIPTRYDDCYRVPRLHAPYQCEPRSNLRDCPDCCNSRRELPVRCPYERLAPIGRSCRPDGQSDFQYSRPAQLLPVVPSPRREPQLERFPPVTSRPPVPSITKPMEDEGMPPGDVPPNAPISTAPGRVAQPGR